ncbi:hypothetical protein P170DRAFT_436790 [Aspergillus steynii IBT 23096]|uniref:Roadblock/LAMTOR2 domain-containing protein n=1 Tax=Aspergillus steynii IBT 23096 TaxID=1392250 RepID=A0A2I2G8G7_9EURO|nr:uncharacterized protein P170DRAFT_436790 [Aspergillus steynii IBT 23096]PLB49164.1 hypothetical protein P170DRAFT_436790 [Aspergillus steynii IBT 23096]
MAATTPPFQIPQHVTALLSHLTSRPGVQSTFILSRKDGSIIQSTGLIASKPAPNVSTPNGAPAAEELDPAPSVASPTSTSTSSATPAGAGAADSSSPSSTPTSPVAQKQSQQQTQQQQQTPTTPYQPSQAEALAAHVFAFVASATDLSLSLSRPPGAEVSSAGSRAVEAGDVNGAQEGGYLSGTGAGAREDAEGGEGFERDEDDEVKLLRMRTKKHEIVVVPDRKYLLCVVHDAAGSAGGGAAVGGVGRGR